MDEAIQPINVQSAKQKIKSYSHNPGSLILAGLVYLFKRQKNKYTAYCAYFSVYCGIYSH